MNATNFLQRIFNKLNTSKKLILPKLYELRFKERLILDKNINFKGIPLIEICKGATVTIGKNVTINSKIKSYHVLLHSPVKLMADRIDAKIEIGDNTRIHGSCIHAWEKITIGQNCLIAANCNIIDSNGHQLSFHKVDERHKTQDIANPVIIEDNVWLGTNVIVLPGAFIGYGSVVSAGSVVRGQIPPYSLVAGNPAIVIKIYKTDGIVHNS